MNSVFSTQKLKNILGEYTASVNYEPILTEVNYSTAPLSKSIYGQTIVLPCDKESDPIIWAATCADVFKDKVTCVLVPGEHFDVYGVRHGRGYGWYDRFLSHIPAVWLRIGITDIEHMSSHHLEKQSWDESMDWVLVFDEGMKTWEVYESHARYGDYLIDRQ